MIFKNLPNDLKFYIKLYTFGECDHCHLINYYWNLKSNITFYEYISIFSDIWDDYYIIDKNPLHFNKICEYCYTSYEDSLHYTDKLVNHMEVHL